MQDESVNPYAPPAEDTVQPLTTGYESEWMLATRGSRLSARMLDGLLQIGAIVPGFFIGIFLDDDAGLDRIGFALMGLGLVALSIYQWYLITTTGQTLGKKWMRIKIVRVSGEPLGFVYGVVLRNWAILALQFIPYLGSLIGLIDVMMIYGEERRCMHDRLAGTKVIDASMG